MKPLVTVLTYCAHPSLAYGTLLTFKTVRTGFPTADIEVYDNGSHPGVRDQVMAECARIGATFTGIKPQSWVDHYKWLLLERQHDNRPLVILDPDMIFWSCVEDWDFTGYLMAGRRMRRINAGRIVQHARLHPALLWIQNVHELRKAMGSHPETFIAPTLTAVDGELHFWDTFSRLYEELAHWHCGFGPERLDCFDHLFFGSHLPIIAAEAKDLDVIGWGHVMASTGNLEALRGIWRKQDLFFAGQDGAAPPGISVKRGDRQTRRSNAAKQLASNQGMEFEELELAAAMDVLARRVGRQEGGAQ